MIFVIWSYKLLAPVELTVKLYVISCDVCISWHMFKLKTSWLNYHEAVPTVHGYEFIQDRLESRQTKKLKSKQIQSYSD